MITTTGISVLDSRAAIKYLIACLRLRDNAAGRNAAREPHIATDSRTTPDGNASKNGGASVDDNIILDNGMPYIAFYQGPMLIHRKALGAESHGLIQAHVFANDSGFADDHPGAVINKKTT